MTSTPKSSAGDYFAIDDYVRTDVAAGVARDRSGVRVVGLPEDFLAALVQTVGAECGPTAEGILQSTGMEWGQQLAVRLTADLERHRGQPVAEASVARFQTDVQSAFAHLGWGVLTLDFSRFSTGLLVAEVRDAPQGGAADALLAGALAGFVSHIAGRELAAAATPAAGDLRRFVIALPERLAMVADALRLGRPHDEVVAALERLRV